MPVGGSAVDILFSCGRSTFIPSFRCLAVCAQRGAAGPCRESRFPMSEDEELQRALQARLPPIACVPREAATACVP